MELFNLFHFDIQGSGCDHSERGSVRHRMAADGGRSRNGFPGESFVPFLFDIAAGG